jgi:hypothetical protein
LKKKKWGETYWYISPLRPDNPSHPIVTKIRVVGGMDEVIKRAMFGVHWLILPPPH